MRSLVVAAAIAAIVSLPAAAGEAKSYGQGVGKAQEVKLVELVSHPDKYLGKAVRVEGIVTDVCPMKGCWMDLSAKSDKVRIKVNDGEMVFPVDAKGSPAVAEGIFTKIEMTKADALAHAKHLAEERGEKLDEARAKNVPTVLYQIQGTGALIK